MIAAPLVLMSQKSDLTRLDGGKKLSATMLRLFPRGPLTPLTINGLPLCCHLATTVSGVLAVPVDWKALSAVRLVTPASKELLGSVVPNTSAPAGILPGEMRS